MDEKEKEKQTKLARKKFKETYLKKPYWISEQGFIFGWLECWKSLNDS